MFGKPEELVWPQPELRGGGQGTKWGWGWGWVGLLILSASLLLLLLLGLSSSPSPPPPPSPPSICLFYLLLNILILILALKSTSASSSTSTSTSSSSPSPHHYYTPCQCQWQRSALHDRGEEEYHSNSIETLTTLIKGAERESASEEGPALVLQRSCSVRELQCKKVKAASNLSRGSSRTQPSETYECADAAPVEVIFEICSTEEECDKENEGTLSISCEELNAKAETFIGNFYRDLKMQREQSWKRLCAIYRKSC